MDFYKIFWIIFHLSNQSNHKFYNRIKQISIEYSNLKNLTPPYSWSQIESNKFRINLHWIFQIFFALSSQLHHKFSNRIERISNKFQFDSNPKIMWDKTETLDIQNFSIQHLIKTAKSYLQKIYQFSSNKYHLVTLFQLAHKKICDSTQIKHILGYYKSP